MTKGLQHSEHELNSGHATEHPVKHQSMGQDSSSVQQTVITSIHTAIDRQYNWTNCRISSSIEFCHVDICSARSDNARHSCQHTDNFLCSLSLIYGTQNECCIDLSADRTTTHFNTYVKHQSKQLDTRHWTTEYWINQQNNSHWCDWCHLLYH